MIPIKVSSPYTFAVVEPGTRFPSLILESGEAASELVGHYSLRQLGIQPLDRTSRVDPFLKIMLGTEDTDKSVWIIDTWIHKDKESERDTNLALVVRGLPHPERLGRFGREFIPAFQRELVVLSESLRSHDKAGAYYHASLITAMLSELDKASSYYASRMKLRRDLFRAYFAAIGLATAVASLAFLVQGISGG